MKQHFITFLLSLTALASSAIALADDCYSSLLKGGMDSSLHQIHWMDIYDVPGVEEGVLNKKAVEAGLSKVLAKIPSCINEAATFPKIVCGTAAGEQLCKAEGDLGYFIVVKDYVDTINFVFNRWD